jgi:hypothetical protein
MDLHLHDKTALVTGASMGIGRAVANASAGGRRGTSHTPEKILATVAVAFLMSLQMARAEDLVPRSYEYQFENNSEAGIPTCTIALFITNFPAPEFVNVRYQFTKSKSQGVQFFSLSVDVGEQLYQNGVPSQLKRVAISSMELIAPGFDSVGRMTDADPGDGGRVQMTADTKVADDLFVAIMRGEFTIRFARQGSTVARGYIIDRAPPEAVRGRWAACLAHAN